MSYPFNLLLGYSILSSFNDNYPLYPHPQEKTWTAAKLAYISIVNWRPTRGLS